MPKRAWYGACCRSCAQGRYSGTDKNYGFIKRIVRRKERHDAKREMRSEE
jgi:hypothetical protein